MDAPTRCRCPASRATSASSTSGSDTGTSQRCCTGSISTSPPGRRSRSSATPAPASRRSRSSSPLLRPAGRAGHDRRPRLAGRHAGLDPLAARHRPKGFLFSGTVAENIAFGRPGRAGRSRPLRRRSVRTRSSRSSPSATTRSSASGGSASRSGSASSWRSPARFSRTRGSSSSTRRPRPSTAERRIRRRLRGARGAYSVRHRPPALDHPARRRHRRARPRAGRGARHA